MRKWNVVLHLGFGILMGAVLSACAPQGKTYKQTLTPQTASPETVFNPAPDVTPEMAEFELVTTYQKEFLQQNPQHPEIKYEAPKKSVQTEQAVIHLDQIKMSKVTMKYDEAQNKLRVQGFVEILDENYIKIDETLFEIEGDHNPDQAVFKLAPNSNEKQNSSLKPVVRAKATCIGIDEKENVSCSTVIVDFFVAYKKKLFSEQMEVKPRLKTEEKPKLTAPPKPETKPDTTNQPQQPSQPKTPAPPTTPAPQGEGKTAGKDGTKTKDKADVENPDEDDEEQQSSETQSEGNENSVVGRYQGQTESTDFRELFKDDEDILAVINATEKPKAQPAPKPKSSSDQPKDKETEPPKKSEEPAKKEDKKSPAPTTPAANQTITPDVSVTDGKMRQTNQAFELPWKGWLRNATSLLTRQESLKKPYFLIAYPQRKNYFGTFEMAEMLSRLGERLHLQFSKTLYVSDISKINGGKLGGHLSHQLGMDADLAYPANDDKIKFPNVLEKGSRRYDPSKISIEKTYDLFKFAFQQTDIKIDRLFVDRAIKKSLCEYAKSKGETTGQDKDLVHQMFKALQHVEGHENHFHLRLRCTPAHPACRTIIYQEQDGC